MPGDPEEDVGMTWTCEICSRGSIGLWKIIITDGRPEGFPPLAIYACGSCRRAAGDPVEGRIYSSIKVSDIPAIRSKSILIRMSE